jgi:taurine dioxygenase
MLPRVGVRDFLSAEAARLRAVRYSRIEIRPLSPVIGAEIGGVDLRAPLDDATFQEIRRAHLDWKVIFFRDQPLTHAQHKAFARRFGALEVHPFLPHVADHPEVISFAKDEKNQGYENAWHSDVTWREQPALGAVLRARILPSVGGDTLFADMYAAWDGLPDDVKARVEKRTATHDFTQSFGLGLSPEKLAEAQRQFPAVEHPIARTHPETGRKALYVNALFTRGFAWLPGAEGRELLDLLCRQASVPEYQCRFRWQPDSLAFWDNRAVQHYAASDYWPERRVMERVTIIGDRPV